MSELLNLVNSALRKVYSDDIELINNRVSERSIVFRFGIYISELIKDTEYEWLNIDTEYNRRIDQVKRTENFPNGTFPDLILHRRGNNENNLLIIEFKPWWNEGNARDLRKLVDFTSADGEYKYQIGLSILLELERPSIILVENGEIIRELDYG